MADIEALKAQLKTVKDAQERLRVIKELGAAFAAAGNTTDSLRAWEAVHKFAPADRDAVRALRLAAMATGDGRGSLDWFHKELALTTEPIDRAYLYKDLGDLYQNRLSDLEGAQQAFAMARQLYGGVFAERPPPPEPEPVAAEPPPPAAPPEAPAPAPAVAPPPVPVVAQRAPGAAVAPRSAKKRDASPMMWAVGVVVLVGLGAAGTQLGPRLMGAPAPAKGTGAFECAGKLERLPDEGDLTVYECVTPLMARRWRLRGDEVLELANYAHGEKEGTIILTPSPGSRTEGAYAGGEKTGVWKTWRDGQLVSDEEWLAGKRNGPARVYQPDGGLLELQEWSLDAKHGAYATWNLAGVKTQEGQYERGTKSGTWSTWDAKGLTDRWSEPRRARDGGLALAESGAVQTEELFAGHPLGWWKIRYAEIAKRAAADPALEPLRALTLERAMLSGLQLSPTSGQLEVQP